MHTKIKMKQYNLTIAKLFEVILSMNEEQQKKILKQADEMVRGDRRILDRKSCHLPVDFATTNHTHKGYIKNISRQGAFIEVKAPIMIGEEVLMIFKVGGASTTVRLRGEITHATRWGIGVEFTAKAPQFDQEIKDLIRRI